MVKNLSIAVSTHCPFGNYYSDILEDSTLLDIGEKYKKTCAQVVLRWCIQQNIIPIVKVVSPKHVIENSQVNFKNIPSQILRKIKMII